MECRSISRSGVGSPQSTAGKIYDAAAGGPSLATPMNCDSADCAGDLILSLEVGVDNF